MAADSERVLKFDVFPSEPDSQMSDREAASILCRLSAALPPSIPVAPIICALPGASPPQGLDQRPNSWVWLDLDLNKDECDKYVSQILKNNPLAADYLVADDFSPVYEAAFSGEDPRDITSGAYFSTPFRGWAHY